MSGRIYLGGELPPLGTETRPAAHLSPPTFDFISSFHPELLSSSCSDQLGLAFSVCPGGQVSTVPRSPRGGVGQKPCGPPKVGVLSWNINKIPILSPVREESPGFFFPFLFSPFFPLFTVREECDRDLNGTKSLFP